jgi:elongation factor P
MHVPIKRGMIIRHQNRIWLVEDYQERHSGQQKPVVHVHMRDILDGRHVDRTVDELVPVQEVDYGYRMMQYLYHRAGGYVFMDNQTFDEHELAEDQLAGFKPFLKEGQEFRIMFVEGRAVRLDLPEFVSLHVTSTAAPEHSVGTAGSVLKEATLENGLVVRVPMFIKNGDLIRVDTRNKTYAGKEKEAHA